MPSNVQWTSKSHIKEVKIKFFLPKNKAKNFQNLPIIMSIFAKDSIMNCQLITLFFSVPKNILGLIQHLLRKTTFAVGLQCDFLCILLYRGSQFEHFPPQLS